MTTSTPRKPGELRLRVRAENPASMRLTHGTTARMWRLLLQPLSDRGEPYTPLALLLEHEHGYDRVPTRTSGKGRVHPRSGRGGVGDRALLAASPAFRVPTRRRYRRCGAEERSRRSFTVVFGDVFDVLTDRVSAGTLAATEGDDVGGSGSNQSFLIAFGDTRGRGELLVNAAHLPDGSSAAALIRCGGSKTVEGCGALRRLTENDRGRSASGEP